MNALNLSAEPPGCLHALLPHELRAEAVVFVPDICPGKSPLRMCTAVLTRQDDWRRFAVSDCGCGMRLVRSELAPADLDARAWVRSRRRLERIWAASVTWVAATNTSPRWHRCGRTAAPADPNRLAGVLTTWRSCLP